MTSSRKEVRHENTSSVIDMSVYDMSVVVEASQRIELQKFKTEMRNSRLQIHNQQHEVLQNIKEMKRRVFDEHNDAVGRAFAEFNAERAKNGELPVTCNEIKKFNEEEANYDRD